MARKTKGKQGLAAITFAALQAELTKRRKLAQNLERLRDRLFARIHKIDARIRTLAGGGGGRASGGGGRTVVARGRRKNSAASRTRASNASGLAPALAKVLKGQTMGVTQVAAAVRKAGYKTNAANFRTIVNACLIKHKGLFKKVSRGQYTAA
jgi:hypothetical protein